MFPRSLSRLSADLALTKSVGRRLAGKTLIELLVAIAIIATVLSLLLPAALQVLKAAYRLR